MSAAARRTAYAAATLYAALAATPVTAQTPELVVEVLSPSTAARDHGIKLERCRHYGVPEYWVVDPEQEALEVWKLAEGAREAMVFDGASVLRWGPAASGPSLDIDLSELFAAE